MTLTNKGHNFGKKFGVMILLFISCFSMSVSTGLSIVFSKSMVLSEYSIGVNFRKLGNRCFEYLLLHCHLQSLL